MTMKRNVWMRGAVLVFVAVIGMTCLPACGGNVYLRGDALTASEASAMDAYQAVHRSGAVESVRAGKQMTWEQQYFLENFRHWRSLVRSAHKNLNWGPTLPNERGE